VEATQSFQYLTYMALADGEFQAEEKPLLKKFGKRLGLSTEQMNQILTAQKEKPTLPKALPEKEEDRQSLFNRLCRVALADHEVSDEEKKILLRVGKRSGMSAATVEGQLKRRIAKDQATEKGKEEGEFSKEDSFRYLCALALADGVLDDGEVEVLQKFGGQLGLNPEQRQEILNNQNRSKDPVKLPQGEDDRQKLFRQVSKMALADEDVAAEEFAIIARIGQSIGMDAGHVESFLKKELKKQINRERAKEKVEASRAQSIVLKLVGIGVIVIALVFVYKFLDSTDKKLDFLKAAVMRLDESSEPTDYSAVRKDINAFKDTAKIVTSKNQASQLLSELKKKQKEQAQAIATQALALVKANRSELSWKARVQQQLERLTQWRSVHPGPIDSASKALRAALREGWGQWGRKIAKRVDAALPKDALHTLVYVSSKKPARQPVTLSEFQEKFGKDSDKGTEAILLLLANIRYHPYFKQSFYKTLVAEAQEMMGKAVDKEHEGELIAFRSRLRACLLIGAEYRQVLRDCLTQVNQGNQIGALQVFGKATYNQDVWFQGLALWLKSEAGKEYIETKKK
jgi:uncharacterized tellurite resistance protein B-like protein